MVAGERVQAWELGDVKETCSQNSNRSVSIGHSIRNYYVSAEVQSSNFQTSLIILKGDQVMVTMVFLEDWVGFHV